MQRAQTRLPVSHQFTKTNDSPPNLGLTWILYLASIEGELIERDKHELVDANGTPVPWRSFFAVLVAVNHHAETHSITGIELLVGYQTKPGAARIQSTGEGLREMLMAGERITTAFYDEPTGKWATGNRVKLLPNGDVYTGMEQLPSFEWVESPKHPKNHGE